MADLSKQAILLVFDRLGDAEPLPAEIVAAELDADEAAVAERLAELEADDVLAVGVDDGTRYWWAKVAPALDPELAAELEADESGNGITLDELDR